MLQRGQLLSSMALRQALVRPGLGQQAMRSLFSLSRDNGVASGLSARELRGFSNWARAAAKRPEQLRRAFSSLQRAVNQQHRQQQQQQQRGGQHSKGWQHGRADGARGFASGPELPWILRSPIGLWMLRRPYLVIAAVLSLLGAGVALVAYLAWKVLGAWSLLIFVLLLTPRSYSLLRRFLSRFTSLVRAPKPRDMSERLFLALDPRHPVIRRHLGRLATFNSAEAELEVLTETSAVVRRQVGGVESSGLLNIYMQSTRPLFELDPKTDEYEATDDLEAMAVTRVTLQVQGLDQELDVTPASFAEEAGESSSTFIDADFEIPEAEKPQFKKVNKNQRKEE